MACCPSNADVVAKYGVDYIKKQIYQPTYHVDVELEQMQIRKGLAKALTDEGLKVVAVNPKPEPPKHDVRPYGGTARPIPIPPASRNKE